MRNFFTNEKGYTLFLAVLISMVFVILTGGLLTLTSVGLNHNNSREINQQALELSEKGLTHITSQINTTLENKIKEQDLLPEDFETILLEELNTYRCEIEPIKEETTTGGYIVCIDDIASVEDGVESITRKQVLFRSVGTVGEKEHVTLSTVIMGAYAVPDALHYAIGVHCKDEYCQEFPGEGNLYLHGGVDITGDLKVDGDVITSEKGYAFLGQQRWIESLKPKINPGEHSDHAKLILGGDVYSFVPEWTRDCSWIFCSEYWAPDYDYHISNRVNYSSKYYRKFNDEHVSHAFSRAPTLSDKDLIRDPVDVKNTIRKFRETVRNSDYQYHHHVTLSGNHNLNKVGIKGNLMITGNNTNIVVGSSHTNESGVYVGNHLTIEKRSNSSPSRDTIFIEGNFYVDGDLTLRNVDVNFNSIIYVGGRVDIQHSIINGKKIEGQEHDGSLIIFADGEIFIANNSVNEPTPSNIRGYFYSNERFEMFGVGSNIKIVGGISARRIVLNAIRGRAQNNWFTGSQYVGGRYFEGVREQESRTSRLQVIYNPGIVGTYSDLTNEVNYIRNIEPPLLKDRE